MNPQLKASNPRQNVWVSASAGTGKTKTLIDRILRLLLTGEDPSKIVCLTYTRAASAEMKIRLHEKLAFWAKADEITLSQDIQALNENPTFETIQTAQHLLHRYLYQNEHVKIQTLHAFCEDFLRRYALEAEIFPFFEIMESSQENKILTQAFDNLMADKSAQVYLKDLSKHLSFFSLKELLEEYISFEQRDGYAPFSPQNVEMEHKPFSFDFPETYLKPYQESTKSTDQEIFEKLKLALNTIDFDQQADILSSVFLTLTGEMRKSLGTKSIPDDIKNHLKSFQIDFFTYIENKKTAQLFIYSKTLHTLGDLFSAHLRSLKEETHLYSFSDIIIFSLKVLQNSASHPWVLVDMTNSISHLLIDEAQDTSPLQWKFLKELIELNFDATSTKRTSLFVVGDFKQSIYSFQGARPEVFQSVFESFSAYLKNQGYSLERINLNTSFRSTSTILNFVDQAFKGPLQKGVLEEAPLTHFVSREDIGKVEIMSPPCTTPEDAALHITKIISHHEHQDIMILFRVRSPYVKKVLKEIEKQGFQTTGLDRFELLEGFTALDLLSITRFCANPIDDMAVALILISPLYHFDEEKLEQVCIKREQPLFMHPIIQELLSTIFQKSQTTSVLDFFTWFLKETGHADLFLNVYGQQAQLIIDLWFQEIRKFEEKHPSSFSLFSTWIQNQRLEAKRDITNTDPTLIRCMTIHGSKGLEAKTVILLEADSSPTLRDRLFLYQDTLFWTPQKDLWPESFKELRAGHKEKLIHEYNRLLYVALTRARDHLYIFSSGEGSELSWGTLLKTS